MTNTERLKELDKVITALAQELISRSHEGKGHSSHIDSFANLCEERRFYIAMTHETEGGGV